MTERTFIIGGTRAEARAWCRENGVAPYARTTRILTTPSAVRGHQIRKTDRVVWFLGPIDSRLLTEVRVAAIAGGSA